MNKEEAFDQLFEELWDKVYGTIPAYQDTTGKLCHLTLRNHFKSGLRHGISHAESQQAARIAELEGQFDTVTDALGEAMNKLFEVAEADEKRITELEAKLKGEVDASYEGYCQGLETTLTDRPSPAQRFKDEAVQAERDRVIALVDAITRVHAPCCTFADFRKQLKQPSDKPETVGDK